MNTPNKPIRKVRLTTREIQVLKLLSAGLPAKELADHLGIATYTANRHLQHIYHKLPAKNRIEAVRWYDRHFRSRHTS